MQLDEIQKRLLREVADLHEVPEGAYNIRSNSQSAGPRTSRLFPNRKSAGWKSGSDRARSRKASISPWL